MKAIYKESIVDVWQISKSNSIKEDWVSEKFDKGIIVWSGNSIRQKIMKEQIAEKNRKSKILSPIRSASRWFLFSESLLNQNNVLPDEIYLVIKQSEHSIYGRLGEYLLKTENGKLIVILEKKAKKELQFL